MKIKHGRLILTLSLAIVVGSFVLPAAPVNAKIKGHCKSWYHVKKRSGNHRYKFKKYLETKRNREVDVYDLWGHGCRVPVEYRHYQLRDPRGFRETHRCVSGSCFYDKGDRHDVRRKQ